MSAAVFEHFALRQCSRSSSWYGFSHAARIRIYATRGAFSSSSSSSSTAAAAAFDLPRIRHEILECWMRAEESSPNCAETRRRSRCGCYTYHDAEREYREPSAPWHWLDRELSSNIAGETGAVYIYNGALAALKLRRDTTKEALDFCYGHQANESAHLSYFQSVVPRGKYTRLLPVWRCAGWVVGFLPTAMGGSRALYVTVEAVETFVEEHFQEQIVPLQQTGSAPELTRLLSHCCEDEVEHKEDAARKLLSSSSSDDQAIRDLWWAKFWSSTVKAGSAAAAEVSRRI